MPISVLTSGDDDRSSRPAQRPRRSCNDVMNMTLCEFCCLKSAWLFMITFAVVAIVTACTVALSFNYVDYNEVAFLQNRYIRSD